ncbi:MAG: SlyX family protein [Pseudomonadota bacterium]|nr:SlyX family protein [Pseudomonadota bacterium]
MDADAVEKLQIKIAFLERANTELSDVLYRQQREIDALSGRVDAALGRLESVLTEERQRSHDEERPPHY